MTMNGKRIGGGPNGPSLGIIKNVATFFKGPIKNGKVTETANKVVTKPVKKGK